MIKEFLVELVIAIVFGGIGGILGMYLTKKYLVKRGKRWILKN